LFGVISVALSLGVNTQFVTNFHSEWTTRPLHTEAGL